MSSYEATKDSWDEIIDGTGEEGSFISADILIMYGIAFLLDMIGYFCLILTITVALAPVAVIIQGITAIMGKLIFTLWIVFIRGHRPSFSLTTVVKKGFSAAKRGAQRMRSYQRKEAPAESGTGKEKSSSTSDDRASTETSTAGEPYRPVQSSTADMPSSDDTPAAETQSSPRATATPGKTTSLLMKWIKRVFVPWLIESTPVLGKIMPTWILSVYFEDKNG